MATIPLMLDQDDNLDRLPSYDEVTSGKKVEQSNSRGKLHSAFDIEFGNSSITSSVVALAHVSIRLGFLRKVFAILSFQLLTTATLCVVLYLVPNVRNFLQHPIFLFVSLISSLALLFALYMNSHEVPLNYILLSSWTIIQSVSIGLVVSFYNVDVVIEAVVITTVVVIALFAYTLQSKRDFQKHYATMFSVLTVFFVASFIQLFLQSSLFNFLVAIAGAGIFSAYLVIDIDRIMHHLSAEDYIDACVSLYLDIVNLFLRILQIINELNRN
uniref:Transmembrane BAX inhibitor motif-containing protein 4 n=1 Tax=Syphacia muris TaxID=451379 RepID=A0A0N5AP47_9BILA